jgi:hypothetical protein
MLWESNRSMSPRISSNQTGRAWKNTRISLIYTSRRLTWNAMTSASKKGEVVAQRSSKWMKKTGIWRSLPKEEEGEGEAIDLKILQIIITKILLFFMAQESLGFTTINLKQKHSQV